MHYTELLNNKYCEGNLWYRHVVTIQEKDTSEVITTMTGVAYYDPHILLCHYSSIAKNLTQGATEVTISRVKMTQIFLQCCMMHLAHILMYGWGQLLSALQ